MTGEKKPKVYHIKVAYNGQGERIINEGMGTRTRAFLQAEELRAWLRYTDTLIYKNKYWIDKEVIISELEKETELKSSRRCKPEKVCNSSSVSSKYKGLKGK